MKRFPEDVSCADGRKSRWKQRNDIGIVLRQTAGSKRIHTIQAHFKKNGDGGSIWCNPLLIPEKPLNGDVFKKCIYYVSINVYTATYTLCNFFFINIYQNVARLKNFWNPSTEKLSEVTWSKHYSWNKKKCARLTASWTTYASQSMSVHSLIMENGDASSTMLVDWKI